MKPLSNQDIRQLAALGNDGREQILRDAGSRLEVRKTASGSVLFRVRTNIGGRRRTFTLGRPDSMTLAQARSAAGDAVSRERLISAGLLVEAPIVLEEPSGARQQGIRVSEACDQWYESLTGLRDSTLNRHRIAIGRIKDAFGALDAASVTRSQCAELLDNFRQMPTPHNDVRNAGIRIWERLSLREQIPETVANPWLRLERLNKPSRDVVLPIPLMVRQWHEASHPRWADAGAGRQFQLATLARRGEVVDLRWEWVDYAAGLITVPPEWTKTKLPSTFPITKGVEAILAEQRRKHPDARAADRVFQTLTGGGVRFDKCHKAFSEALDIDSESWRQHDWRRSGVTALADSDLITAEEGDVLLNHVVGSTTTRVYQRSAMRKQQFRAAEIWWRFFSRSLKSHKPSAASV